MVMLQKRKKNKMLVKILIVGGLIFLVGRNLFKMAGSNPTIQNKKKPQQDDDIIDAEYSVVDDDK